MQVGERTSGVLVMKEVVQVSSAVCIKERQLGRRTSEGLLMKGVVLVSSEI